jgi:hypothetical protein
LKKRMEVHQTWKTEWRFSANSWDSYKYACLV